MNVTRDAVGLICDKHALRRRRDPGDGDWCSRQSWLSPLPLPSLLLVSFSSSSHAQSYIRDVIVHVSALYLNAHTKLGMGSSVTRILESGIWYKPVNSGPPFSSMSFVVPERIRSWCVQPIEPQPLDHGGCISRASQRHLVSAGLPHKHKRVAWTIQWEQANDPVSSKVAIIIMYLILSPCRKYYNILVDTLLLDINNGLGVEKQTHSSYINIQETFHANIVWNEQIFCLWMKSCWNGPRRETHCTCQ